MDAYWLQGSYKADCRGIIHDSCCAAGAGVPYLAPFYASYKGPQMLPLHARGLRILLQHIIKYKNPPPAPFDQGISQNLNEFFFHLKPIAYHERLRAAEV